MERRQLSLAARQELARRDPYELPQLLRPTWRNGRHHRLLFDVLHGVSRGELDRVIIQLPPRHSKSQSTAVMWPAWFLGKQPNRRICVASYGANLATRHSKQCRDLCKSDSWRQVFGHALGDQRADEWDIAGFEGGYKAIGVGGGITGHGFDIGVIDDPHRSFDEADSQAMRDMVDEWFQGTFYDRQEGLRALVVVMQRWHEDDLVGRLRLRAQQDPEADQWHFLNLAALAEEQQPGEPPDPLGRAPGEALWPERVPVKYLNRVKRNVLPRVWSAKFQGRPLPAEGGMFKAAWFKTVPAAPDRGMRWVRFWDSASKTKERNDYSAGVLMGIAPTGDLFLRDIQRGKWEIGDLVEQTLLCAAGDPPGTIIAVEDTANGTALLQILSKDKRARRYTRKAVQVAVDKVTRAGPFATDCFAGLVYLVAGEEAPWIGEFLKEITSFPDGTHDDQVDAATGAHAELIAGGWSSDQQAREFLRKRYENGAPEPDDAAKRQLADAGRPYEPAPQRERRKPPWA